VSYGVRLEESALRQMGGMPDEALDAVTERMARICLDPYDRMLSMPVSASRPAERMAELGDDAGFIEFTVDDAAKLVMVRSVIWLG
jgi:hypothetical protein